MEDIDNKGGYAHEGQDGKESFCNAGDLASIPGLGRFPGEGNGNMLQFLPGKPHGQRSLVGYSPWGCKELDMTEQLTYTCEGFQGGTNAKEPICQSRRHKRCGLDTWIRKIPWRRPRQPTLVFLPGESYGQRSLAGSSHGVAELEMTE